jgi:acyl-CoA thioester hydrolase
MTTNHRPVLNETRLRVRYAETDQMGVVYHSNHFIWFEVGRVELMRQMGFAYRDIERNESCFIAVAEAKCQYRAPVFYDEEVVVRTWLKSVRKSVIVFSYELLRPGTDILLAEGETLHIVIDRNMKLAKLPEKYFTAFRAAVRRKHVEKAIERSAH